MFGTHDLVMFVIAGLLLNITPGADTLYIVGRSASQGARAGAVAALGIGAGCFVHVSAAALGLSALLSASALGFAIVKYIGAAYLFYLGVSMIVRRSRPAESAQKLAAEALSRVFWGGFLTNALNPKTTLFVVALFTQVISPDTATLTQLGYGLTYLDDLIVARTWAQLVGLGQQQHDRQFAVRAPLQHIHIGIFERMADVHQDHQTFQ